MCDRLLPTMLLGCMQDDDGNSSLGGNQFLSEVSAMAFCLLYISPYTVGIFSFALLKMIDLIVDC